jgi:hypothetical protein
VCASHKFNHMIQKGLIVTFDILCEALTVYKQTVTPTMTSDSPLHNSRGPIKGELAKMRTDDTI